MPLNVENSFDLVDLSINTFRLNCIPVVALDTKMIDPIIYDGTRGVHNVHVPFGWSVCSLKSVQLSTPEAEENVYLSRTEDGMTMIFSELSEPVTASGVAWAIPDAKILAGPEYKCAQYPVYGKLQHNCSDVIPPPKQDAINLWANQISSAYASSGHITQRFLAYAPTLTTKKIARIINGISYIHEVAHPVFTKLGWINGSMVTLQTNHQNIEAILICRILLCALRHKAAINTLVGLRIIDESGYELISWAPDMSESI